MNQPNDNWFDNKSWPAERPVEIEPDPGTKEYLQLGCDDLYQDLGGEG